MGYFSNGTEWEQYESAYCNNCIHDKNNDCPIIASHFLYSYDLCNEEKHPGKVMLDLFIPIKENGFCDQCTMFIPN